MKNKLFLIAALLVFMSCSSETTDPQTRLKIQNIENGLVEYNPAAQGDSAFAPVRLKLTDRMTMHKIPGVSIAVIDDNKIDWALAYNSGDNSDMPVTTETIFEAASTTKLLVSTIALMAVERGMLELDENINNYLKSWKIPENDLTKDSKITLRLLLSHRSGLNRPDGGFGWENGSNPSLIQVLEGEKPADNDSAFVEYTPGSKIQYSNMGYIVIQLLLEDVYGKPLSQIARDLLFEPLNMLFSTMVYPLPEQFKSGEAMPHNAEGEKCQPVMHPTAVAQGGLMTTPSNLAIFAIELMKAYQGQPNKLFSQQTARLMFTPEIDIDPAIMGFPLSEGLGVFLRGKGQAISFLHPGDNYPGASCWLEVFPALGKGVIIMTNGAKGNLLALEMRPAVAEAYSWPRQE